MTTADLEQHVTQRDVELNITRRSHEQVPLLTEELANLNAALQQTSSLEQQQRLKIADLEQRVTQQDAELNITRSSHEHMPLLTKELADLNTSLQQASSLEQEQRLKIADTYARFGSETQSLIIL